LPCLTTFLYGEISRLGNSKIKYLSPFVAPHQFFEPDGVHLTPDAGFQFLRFIYDGVDQIFPTPRPSAEAAATGFPASTSAQDSGPTSFLHVPPSSASVLPVHHNLLPSTSGAGVSLHPAQLTSSPGFALEFSRVSSALNTLSGLTSTLRSEVQTRRSQDNLIFARLKEDRDFEFNKNREDRFTVSGLVTSSPPKDPQDRKEFYRLRLQHLVDIACPDFEPKPLVVDVFVNLRNGQSSPFLEGRMDTVASASAFRVAASKLAKEENPDFKDLFIANAVTLATRVRIEILRAISKVLTTENTDSFVQGFSSRPLLHYYRSEGSTISVEGVNRTYTFVEAVSKFGHLVPPSGLLNAYKRARPSFNGCLEQYFVILREEGPPIASGFNAAPLGTRGGHSDWRGSVRSRFRGRGPRFSSSASRRGGRYSRGSIHSTGTPSSGPSDSRKRLLDNVEFEGTPTKRSAIPAAATESLLPIINQEVMDSDSVTPHVVD